MASNFWNAPAEPAVKARRLAELEEPEPAPEEPDQPDHRGDYADEGQEEYDEYEDEYDEEDDRGVRDGERGYDAQGYGEGAHERRSYTGSDTASRRNDRPEPLIGDTDERGSMVSHGSRSSGVGKAHGMQQLAAALRTSVRNVPQAGAERELEVEVEEVVPLEKGREAAPVEEEEEEDTTPPCLSLEPLRWSFWRYFFYLVGIILSAGVLWLLARNNPRVQAFCTKRRSQPGERPQFILFQGMDLKWYQLRIHKHSLRNSKEMRELCGQAEEEPLEGAGPDVEGGRLADPADMPREADDEPEAAGKPGGRRLTPAERRRIERRRVFYIDFQAKRFTSFDKFRFSSMQFKFAEAIRDVVESYSNGLSTKEAKLRLKLCGFNDIRAGIPPFSQFVLEKALRPYYLFQIFCIALWIFEGYAAYAYVVLAISLLTYLYELRVGWNRRRKLIKRLGDDLRPVRVLRDGREVLLSAEYLVPGDVLLLEADAPVPCDVVILEGECLVDESMFQGQPLPLSKQALPHREMPLAPYSPQKFPTSTILGGSRILQVYGEAGLRVLVSKTGYSTVKGAFFHSGVLFRKKSTRNALIDLQWYLVVMALLGIGGAAAALIQILYRRAQGKEAGPFDLRDTFVTCAGFTTIALPPSIQLCFSLCNAFAAYHMKSMGVKCLDTDCMPVAGKINTICLDKTGVMTSEKIMFQGVHPTSGARFREVATSLLGSQSLGTIEQCLAICHALNAGVSDLTARPIDIEPFRATGWKLIEPDRKREDTRMVIVVCKPPPRIPTGAVGNIDQNEEWAVLRRFAFDARTRCSSVIALGVESNMLQAFVKGAPESIRLLCRPHTVPLNFAQVLRSHEEQGFVVLACGVKVLPSCNPTEVNMIKRSAVESSLDFAGFLLLRNSVRPETTRFMDLSKEARLKTAMITGDSLLTAVAVAKKCTMISRDPRVFVADAVAKHNPAGPEASSPRGKGGAGMGSTGARRRRASVVSVESAVVKHDSMELVFFDANNDTRQFTFPELIESIDKDPDSSCLAVTGACVRYLADGDEVDNDMLVELAKRARLYTRVSPDDKVAVIEVLLDRLELWCAMVGDGLNDCGALRAAPMGLAIGAQLTAHTSEARAVAPLETKTGDISAMLQVLRQGQCTLVTATSIFRFIAIYSALQLAYTLRLFYIGSDYMTGMMLYQDLAIMLPLAVLMCFNRARTSGIAPTRPRVTIVHLVVSVLLEMIIFLIVLVSVEWYLRSRDWYCELSCDPTAICPSGAKAFVKTNCGTEASKASLGESYDQSVTWSMGSIQMMAASLSVNFHGTDSNFRRPILHNVFFVLYWTLLFVITTWIHVAPPREAIDLFGITKAPTDFLIVTYVIACGTLPVTIILEKFVSPRVSDVILRWFHRIRESFRAKRVARDQRRREERMRKQALAQARAADLLPKKRVGFLSKRKARRQEKQEHIRAMRAAAEEHRRLRQERAEQRRRSQIAQLEGRDADPEAAYEADSPADDYDSPRAAAGDRGVVNRQLDATLNAAKERLELFAEQEIEALRKIVGPVPPDRDLAQHATVHQLEYEKEELLMWDRASDRFRILDNQIEFEKQAIEQARQKYLEIFEKSAKGSRGVEFGTTQRLLEQYREALHEALARAVDDYIRDVEEGRRVAKKNEPLYELAFLPPEQLAGTAVNTLFNLFLRPPLRKEREEGEESLLVRRGPPAEPAELAEVSPAADPPAEQPAGEAAAVAEPAPAPPAAVAAAEGVWDVEREVMGEWGEAEVQPERRVKYSEACAALGWAVYDAVRHPSNKEYRRRMYERVHAGEGPEEEGPEAGEEKRKGKSPDERKEERDAIRRFEKYKRSARYQAEKSKALRDIPDLPGFLAGASDDQRVTGVKIGGVIIDLFVKNVKILDGDSLVPAVQHFLVSNRATRKVTGFLGCHPRVIEEISNAHGSKAAYFPRFLPMIVPPMKWSSMWTGGYLTIRTNIMRTVEGASKSRQIEAFARRDARPLYEGLNVLSSVPWKINKRLLEAIKAVRDEGGDFAELPPSRPDPFPEPPRPPPEATWEEKEKWRQGRRRARQRNWDVRGLQRDLEYKLAQAESMKPYVFYFPHNIDFRGRAYPIPPHLNHLGSDTCRGMLLFARGRPLGEKGLRWLMIHLANLAGKDKLPFEERIAFIRDSLPDIVRSADYPLTGWARREDRWWAKADAPWQCLACCIELVAALRSPDPRAFVSCLPVHQDGSCNGLQHYAALGRDERGAQQVDLIDSEKPSDVYSAVAAVLKELVKKDAAMETTDGREERIKIIAQRVYPEIDRKLVKQTVMTSVYGVTFIGARKQIQNRLEERAGFSEETALFAATYLARKTLEAIGDIFQSAKDIMRYLGQWAKAIAKQDKFVTWPTPMAFIATQPYTKPGRAEIVRTPLQSVNLTREQSESPNVMKQKSAFPPNYVHSLDSAHMLFTAQACRELHPEMTFVAVHDSYWTHACDVDAMNRVLRQEFVKLHGPDKDGKTLLDRLQEYFENQYYQLKRARDMADADGGRSGSWRRQLPSTPDMAEAHAELLPGPGAEAAPEEEDGPEAAPQHPHQQPQAPPSEAGDGERARDASAAIGRAATALANASRGAAKKVPRELKPLVEAETRAKRALLAARGALAEKRRKLEALPPAGVVQRGTLDLQRVLHSKYFFD
eukprot:tig00021493_g21888.t1